MFQKKKFLISHRGNINGPDNKYENSYDSINLAIREGYDVEIDIRYYKKKLFIGHDEPQFEFDFNKFLNIDKIWFHCKDIDSITIIKNTNIKKFFFHQKDDITLTSNDFLWTYPGKKITKYSIIVLPENTNYKENDFKICCGICSDFIKKYKYD